MIKSKSRKLAKAYISFIKDIKMGNASSLNENGGKSRRANREVLASYQARAPRVR
jgi:hypothetical protein